MAGVVERFPSTGNQLVPALTGVLVAVASAASLLDGWHRADAIVLAGCLFLGLLVWAVYLRPAVWATESALVLRNAVDTVEIPLAAIERVAIGRMLAVVAGGRRWISTAHSRSLRSLAAGAGRGIPVTGRPPSAADFVEDRIAARAEAARARAGIRLLSDEQLEVAAGVRRSWAWPVIGALAGSALLVLLAAVL